MSSALLICSYVSCKRISKSHRSDSSLAMRTSKLASDCAANASRSRLASARTSSSSLACLARSRRSSISLHRHRSSHCARALSLDSSRRIVSVANSSTILDFSSSNSRFSWANFQRQIKLFKIVSIHKLITVKKFIYIVGSLLTKLVQLAGFRDQIGIHFVYSTLQLTRHRFQFAYRRSKSRLDTLNLSLFIFCS